MITFFISLIALIVGFMIYGRFVEKVFAPSLKPTPAITHNDGVDYIPLPTWKVFMIQLLNIAGLELVSLSLMTPSQRIMKVSFWSLITKALWGR